MAYIGHIFPRYTTPFAYSDGVVIRTNSQFTNLIIDAAQDEVLHYGNAKEVHITAVKMASYYEHGSVGTINLKAGKVEIEKNAFVGKVAVDKDVTSSTAAVINEGTVFAMDIIIYDEDEYTHDSLPSEDIASLPDDNPAKVMVDDVDTTSSSDTIKVGTAEALINLALAQSTGLLTGNNGVFNIELTANIDLKNKTWTPFGAQFENLPHYKFSGVFDGKGHTITGLNNGDFYGAQITNSSGITGETYGFIAFTYGDVEVKDVTFSGVNIDASNASVCGVVIGDTADSYSDYWGRYTASSNLIYMRYATKSLKLTNVTVNGNVSAKDKAAGLIGYPRYMKPSEREDEASIIIDNCHVNANIYASGNRAGGFLGYFGDGSQIKILDSSMSGSVESKSQYNGALFSAELDGNINLKQFIDVENFTTDAEIIKTGGGISNDNSLVNGNGIKLGYTKNDTTEIVGTTFLKTVQENHGINKNYGFIETYDYKEFGDSTYVDRTTDFSYTAGNLKVDVTVGNNNVISSIVIYRGTFYRSLIGTSGVSIDSGSTSVETPITNVPNKCYVVTIDE